MSLGWLDAYQAESPKHLRQRSTKAKPAGTECVASGESGDRQVQEEPGNRKAEGKVNEANLNL
mgnify:CR=1 FL=1